MAPTSTFLDQYLPVHHPHFFKRNSPTPRSAFLPLAIIAAILSVITLIVAAWSLYCLWTRILLPKLAARRSRAAKAAQDPTSTKTANPASPTLSRRRSNWARKDSNVLFASYIDDDDLNAQFSSFSHWQSQTTAAKNARLFSVGSVSTFDGDAEHSRCPLDTTPTRFSKGRGPSVATVKEGQEMEKAAPRILADDTGKVNEYQNVEEKMRSNSTYEQGKTRMSSLSGRMLRAASTPDGKDQRRRSACETSLREGKQRVTEKEMVEVSLSK